MNISNKDLIDQSFDPIRKHRKYDESNQFLIVPTKKSSKPKNKKDNLIFKKQLSKTKLKKLNKLKEQKIKRIKRKESLGLLNESIISKEERKLIQSTSHVQTSGKRKAFIEKIPYNNDCQKIEIFHDDTNSDSNKINEIDHIESNGVGIIIDKDFSVENIDQNNSNVNADKFNNSKNNNTLMDISPNKSTPSLSTLIIKKVNKLAKPLSSTKLSVMKFKKVIKVVRDPKIQAERENLPILGEEYQIMEKINDHPIVIICGETGCGKTTQIPQFLYEAGFCEERRIGITEPRRVAAVTISQRVAIEMKPPKGQIKRLKTTKNGENRNDTTNSSAVAYQIRFEGNVTPATKIKFMTDGVLMKEIQNDFMLTDYSAIVIDEAHERSVCTDILIGLLSRIVPLRHKRNAPLKLIIMSATLRIKDFTENQKLFKGYVPVIKIPSKKHPVTIHYNISTPMNDYVQEAYRKVCKIHNRLPPGDILVFLTGRAEIMNLCKALDATFPTNSLVPLPLYSLLPTNQQNLVFNFHNRRVTKKDSTNDCNNKPQMDKDSSTKTNKVHKNLNKNVSETPRLCVVATNVAETSITVPGVRYVIDCGRVKKFSHNGGSNIEDRGVDNGRKEERINVGRSSVEWISKASADQRAGRCGRTGPGGHCYRLYSSAVFNDQFSTFSCPEIMEKPIEDVVLQMKLLNIDRIENFPFPTPPPLLALRRAEALLCALGLLEPFAGEVDEREVAKVDFCDRVNVTGCLYNYLPGIGKQTDPLILCLTDLGRLVANVPLNPRQGKLLALILTDKTFPATLMPFALTIAASTTIRELFIAGDDRNNSILNAIKNSWAGITDNKDLSGDKNSDDKRVISQDQFLLGDMIVNLRAVGASDYIRSETLMNGTPRGKGLDDFCQKYLVRRKALDEIYKLRRQIYRVVALKRDLETNGDVLTEERECVDDLEDNYDNDENKVKNPDPNKEKIIIDKDFLMTQPPSQKQMKALRKLILACAGFNIAKRIDLSPEDHERLFGKRVGRKAFKSYYQCLTEGSATSNSPPIPAFIQPSSVMFRSCPDYIVYQESYLSKPFSTLGDSAVETSPSHSTLNLNRNIHLKTITAVQPQWLPVYMPQLCHFDIHRANCTLDDITNDNSEKSHEVGHTNHVYYDPSTGKVKCRASCLFGPHKWDIGFGVTEFPYTTEKFRHFAKFFLEGQLFSCLKIYVDHLLLTPSTMLKTWAKLQTKTQTILKALIEADIHDKSALVSVWTSGNSNFLLNQYLEWLPESLHSQVTQLWPPYKT
ncbi:unnamed protein product [Gordionus sp. m RMFG-2023]